MIVADVILFDLGNTLFYDRPSAWPAVYRRAEKALWKGLRRSGVKAEPAELYEGQPTLLAYYYTLRGTGVEERGTRRVLTQLLHKHGEPIDDKAIEKALRAMYAVTQTNWKLEHDAVPTLRTLARMGFHLGAVSNGSDHRNALELLDRARCRAHFEVVVTSEAHGLRKPDASIFQVALSHFGAEPHRAVMIGDSYEADILGAVAVGISTIWVTRRAAPPQAAPQVEPDATVRALREVPSLVSHP